MRLLAGIAFVSMAVSLSVGAACAQSRVDAQTYRRIVIQNPPGEPPSAILLLTGVAGVAFLARRRRRIPPM